MRDARCAMRDARCAMRDARCAMRDARCAMRDARCAWTLARPRSSRAPLTKWRMRGTYATSARRVTRRRPLPGVAGCCPRSDRNGTAGTRARR
ncbi:AraC family transcriptional regulator [Burkholderia pseudomallei]|nr:AraC family transcriptional regulator [Burkholderia pseudomallei]